jgi:hypothetical protein
MVRPRPPTLAVMAVLCCAFAVLYGCWLLSFHGGNFLAMVTVAGGDPEPLPGLAPQNLASAGPAALALTFAAVQVALVGVLVWAGVGLWLMWPSARWSALAWSAFSVATALLDTVVRLFFLTLPGEVVKLTPFLLDAAAILFAVNLWGTMVLPSVTEAYAGLWEPAVEGPDAPPG